ncbi:MxaD protein [Methylobacterium sp. Leaf456]|uniref:SRPBCC family protein n=1 Tax=Methylobacterium sp. Leaf456 TaxID=1736382 RepID=UPI0006FCC26C|nr:SRPBCC family protein [Methylobacterium sp. Leaf456]KQT55412.1 MxaD protein [Methylobacterium sp. Leaf456]
MLRAIYRTVGILAAWAGSSAVGHAIEVTRTLNIAASPSAVWAVTGDFCSIQRWHPQVETCSLSNNSDDDGRLVPFRSLAVANGLGTIVEVETGRDDEQMTYSYAFVQGPLPVRAYNATLRVQPDGANATVIWTATFDAHGMTEGEAKADIEGVYDEGLAGIAREVAR